ncbi:ABC transporter substrate-binding protein [Thalassomonas haliotis]|uniref:ABC transporter substrate-binding protein n=1 Tax=Thalassomonas haliotis TaxID=485448 RepID=A0ABY7VLC4_9GAMM|nr:ABC transporter substrate binding protein [Thalassomonas haliotis]WDE13871.1 hypothetical protein H3N35_10760 [Thalassomonas haliotis]
MKWIHRAKFLTLLLLVCCFSSQAESLTVVYPEVKAPYDKIFQQITRGIAEEADEEILEIKLSNQFDPDDAAKKITTDKVIALGKRGLQVARKIYKDKPVVVGALPIRPNGISGVSLTADPDELFDYLHELAPKITKVTVLYTPASAWVIDDAKEKAKAKGLSLNGIKVENIREAVKAYDRIFAREDLSQTAIWLPLDPITANDKIIVPVILEKAWSNKMVVFSSKPNHAKRGALFSAIPNNELLGRQLVRLVEKISAQPLPSIVKPLKTVKLAVNLRTAAHLGYEYGSGKRSGFALTFPK